MFEIYWKDRLVGFDSILNMPSGTIKNAFREHRLVVLPDYQGLGFGTKISEFVGEYLIQQGCKFFSRSTHIRLGRHRTDSNLWTSTSTNQVLRSNINEQNATSTQGKKYSRLDDSRIAYSFEYVGNNFNELEHQKIVCLGECEEYTANKLMDLIIDKNKYPIICSGIASISEITIWEKIAKERSIRTEVLFIKRKDEYFINKTIFTSNVDCVLTDDKARDSRFEFESSIKNCITYSKTNLNVFLLFDYKTNKIITKISTL